VHLNIPYSHNYARTVLPDWVPSWLEKYPHLKIFRCPDFGPITKIYPTIQRVTDPETIIITVDDDLYYCPGFIEAHLRGREKYPDCAIGYAGIHSIEPYGWHFATSVNVDMRVRMLEGYKTVSYKRSFFDDELDKFVFAHWNDDYSLGAYLGYKNIHKMVLAWEHDTDFSPRVESFPCIGHVPITGDRHACNLFRDNTSIQASGEEVTGEWYKEHWLER